MGRRWTDLTQIMSFCVYKLQATEPYSHTGRARDKHARSLTTALQDDQFLWSTSRILSREAENSRPHHPHPQPSTCLREMLSLANGPKRKRLDDPGKWAVLMPNGRKRRLPHRNGTLSQIGRILWKHIAHLLKTNLTKFAVICLKKRQKARFLSPRSSKIIVTKEKERRKKKSEEKKGNNGCTLSFYNSYRYPPTPLPYLSFPIILFAS